MRKVLQQLKGQLVFKYSVLKKFGLALRDYALWRFVPSASVVLARRVYTSEQRRL
jgi:hypothetical protein